MLEWKNDNWNYIVFKWDNRVGSLRIYFNCILVKVVNKSKRVMFLEDNKLLRFILGVSYVKKNYMKLMVDEFVIWNYIVLDDLLCKVFRICLG